MYLTCRGQRGALAVWWKMPGFKASPGAGLTVLDVSDPLQPKVLERWDSPNRLEGQDRRGALLVVTQIYDGWLYTFDADNVAAGPRGRCKLQMDGALHVRLHTDAGRRRRTSRQVPLWEVKARGSPLLPVCQGATPHCRTAQPRPRRAGCSHW